MIFSKKLHHFVKKYSISIVLFLCVFDGYGVFYFLESWLGFGNIGVFSITYQNNSSWQKKTPPPNGPSKTGNPSGKGRGNNDPKPTPPPPPKKTS